MRVYTRATPFPETVRKIQSDFLRAPAVDVGEWQSMDIRGVQEMVSYEMQDTSVEVSIPNGLKVLQEYVEPNLPWAEDHFLERVSGEPLNPPPSEAYWPFAQQGNKAHKTQGEKFSHTYPERFWPKFAGEETRPNGRSASWPNNGVRFEYGDLGDVVEQLIKNPMTRQAYLPVWFPEDTGAVHGERVPCTLGYHFLIRNKRLTITYYIRSCDFMRHFRDDVYMAARLAQWVCGEIKMGVTPEKLVMHIASFHIFEGDLTILRSRHATKS